MYTNRRKEHLKNLEQSELREIYCGNGTKGSEDNRRESLRRKETIIKKKTTAWSFAALNADEYNAPLKSFS